MVSYLRRNMESVKHLWGCKNDWQLHKFISQNFQDANEYICKEEIFMEKQVTCLYFQNSDGIIRKVIASNFGGETELFTQLQWELHTLKGLNTISESKYTKVYSNTQAEDSLLDFMDRYLDYWSALFNRKLYSKIEIRIIGSQENVFGRGVDGFFDCLKCIVYVDELNKYVAHELVHALMWMWEWRTNLFCMEGMAESQKEPISALNVKDIGKCGFDELYYSCERELDARKYVVSGFFFRFLFEQYGTGMLEKVCMCEDSDIEKFSSHLTSVLGININSIMYEFRKWMLHFNLQRDKWYGIE